MLGLGSIIGGALGGGASIFGGIKASEAMRKAKQGIERAKDRNSDWYNRRYNEDATQRADAQRVLSQLGESIRDRNRQAAGTAALTGASEESVAAAKAANNGALAEAASQIAAAGDRRKDAVEQQYKQTEADLDNRLNNMEVARAQAISQAVQGAAKSGSMFAQLSALDDEDLSNNDI